MIAKDLSEFCYEDVSLIENYDKAIKDDKNIWQRHHRLETHYPDGTLRENSLSADELKDSNLYYNRPAKEFIFLTRYEHLRLHNSFQNLKDLKSKIKKGKAMKGLKFFNNGIKNIRARECLEGVTSYGCILQHRNVRRKCTSTIVQPLW